VEHECGKDDGRQEEVECVGDRQHQVLVAQLDDAAYPVAGALDCAATLIGF